MPRESYREAGNILVSAREHAIDVIHAGQTHYELAKTVESHIRQRGGQPAFPVNISIDNEAAHRTPAPDESTVFGEDDLVCLDIGVHVDGFIADSAVTIDLGDNHPNLRRTAEEALAAAIETVEAGVTVGTIGTAAADVIEDTPYQPVRNLSGHGVAQWNAHCDPTIPNIAANGGATLSEGDVVAIEPFVTTGSGTVNPTNNVEIYELEEEGRVRNRTARRILKSITESYPNLPFARRWLDGSNVNNALRRLVRKGIVRAHPVLADDEGSCVAQAEHTVYVTEDGCEVLTAPSNAQVRFFD